MNRSQLMDFGLLSIKPWIINEESVKRRVASDFLNLQGPNVTYQKEYTW